jgi:hypothetical protein
MLNLVQLQERLKDVPMQALMQYANGSNPQVPPFLALGELNRRKKMQESAAADQAQEMEGAPTVKQQIEQATGLMALQGSRQRQAAQQQQGIQANMPMAAPNTTTSEPAQLAGGGFIDDIVVPRDYQAGGQVNPEMMKKLMMLKMMQKRRPGIAGIPMQNMFKRSDYAGGGIVAFERGGAVKRVSGKTLSEYLASVADSLKANTQMTEQEKIDAINRAREQFNNSPADPGFVDPTQYPEEQNRGIRTQPAARTPAQPPVNLDELFGGRGAPGQARGLGALSKFLKVKPEDVYPDRPERSFEDMMAQRQQRQRQLGISEEYLDERDRRLAALQARRESERADQPMNELTRFLQGVAAGPRGGTFGTQGASGVAASTKYREEQRALKDKQDLDMEELKFASASKRDAIRRGDLKDIEAATQREEDARRKVAEDRANLLKSQATAETQGVQAESYARQVGKPTSDEQIQALYRRYVQDKGLTPSVEGYLEFRNRILLGGKASMVMTREDAIARAIQSLGPGASMDEIRSRAEELMRLGGASGGPSVTVPSGVKVTREK